MLPPAVVRTLPELRATVAAWRREGLRVGLVPTMGALHDGPPRADAPTRRRAADRVGARRLRQPDPVRAGARTSTATRATSPADLARLAAVGVDAGLAPARRRDVPAGRRHPVTVEGLADGLERRVAARTSSAGVATVVAKLLNQVQPDLAVFGEKDYQQLSGRPPPGARPRHAAEILARRRCASRTASRSPRATPPSPPAERAFAPALHRGAHGRPAGRSPTAAAAGRGSSRGHAPALGRASRASTISSFATPRTWRRWTTWPSGPPASSRPPPGRDPPDRQRAGPASLAIALFERDDAAYRRRRSRHSSSLPEIAGRSAGP